MIPVLLLHLGNTQGMMSWLSGRLRGEFSARAEFPPELKLFHDYTANFSPEFIYLKFFRIEFGISVQIEVKSQPRLKRSSLIRQK
jgi:hypothetical protein